MPSLSSALTDRINFLVARQGVVASNVANANTPGYLAKDITFQSALETTVAPVQTARTNAMHMAPTQQSGSSKAQSSARFVQHNGNAVRIDQEMLKMQDTQLNYRYMTQIYTKQVAMQKMALGGR